MKYPAPRRATDDDLSVLDRPPAPTPLAYWQTPDWEAFLRGMREAPNSMTDRLVAADYIEENGAPERAAFVRERARLLTCDMKRPELWLIPSRVIREWFALGGLLPNTAQTQFDHLNYYAKGTEGEYAFPFTMLRFFCGFADCLVCDALTLTRAMDDLYAREPVREVNVSQWSYEGADGKPIISQVPMTDRVRDVSVFVAGRKVEFKEVDFHRRLEKLGNPERTRAECAFEARWPGVAFTVNL